MFAATPLGHKSDAPAESTPDACPTFATVAVSDEQIAEMNRDLADVIRNNEALTEAELTLLAQRADRDTAAALALSIVAVVNANPPAKPADQDETRVSAHGYGRFKAFAKLAGGRWIPAGHYSYRHEADAWKAAADKLAALRREADADSRRTA